MAQGTVSTMSGQPAVLGGPGTPGNGNMPNMGQSMAPSSMMTGQRTRIWMGVIEYHDKVPAPAYKSLYLLDCTITYQSQPHDPEFKSTKWPDKLLINTVPKTLINRLSPIFKNNSFHINFHFSSDSPGLKKLITAMSANSVCAVANWDCNV